MAATIESGWKNFCFSKNWELKKYLFSIFFGGLWHGITQIGYGLEAALRGTRQVEVGGGGKGGIGVKEAYVGGEGGRFSAHTLGTSQ